MASLKQEPISLPQPSPSPSPGPLSIATLSDPNPTSDPPMAVPLHPHPIRRLPPPCWTPDETSTLIDSYRNKWYSLRRGNLRAAHWQDVATEIHSRCPNVFPPKTAIQCRHKMEKLRKRYRSELLRANSLPNHRFSSSWIYFSRMDAMENDNSPSPAALTPSPAALPSPIPLSQSPSPAYNDSDDFTGFTTPRANFPNPNYGHKSTFPQYNGARFVKNHEIGDNNRMNYVNVSSGGGGTSNEKKRRKVDEGTGKEKREEAVMEMVEAIRMLGEGFVRMETIKIEMMKETERMRMEMEMKRTEMLLQSQHRLVEAFAKGWSDVVNNSHDNNNDDDE